MAVPLLAAAGMFLASEAAKEDRFERDNASQPPRVPPIGNASYEKARTYYSPFQQPMQFNVDTGANFGGYYGAGIRRTPHGLPHGIRDGAFGAGGKWNLNKTGADEPTFGTESDRPIRRLGSTTTPEDLAARQSLYNQLYNPDIRFTGRHDSTQNWRIYPGRSIAMHHKGSVQTVLPKDKFVPQDYPQQRDTVLGPYHPPVQRNSQGTRSLNNKSYKIFDEKTKRNRTVLRLGKHVDRNPLGYQPMFTK